MTNSAISVFAALQGAQIMLLFLILNAVRRRP